MNRILVVLAALVASLALAGTARAVTIQEFPLAAPASLYYLKSGPDRNLWVVDQAGNAIRRVSTAGTALTPLAAVRPQDIAVGPTGNVYWTETGTGNGGDGAVVRVTPDGLRLKQDILDLLAYTLAIGPGEKVTVAGRLQGGPYADTAGTCEATFATATTSCGVNTGFQARLTSLVYGNDGRQWGILNENSRLQQFLPDPAVGQGSPQPGTVVTLPGDSLPGRAVQGPDGNLWVTMGGANAIDRIKVLGFERTRFVLPGNGKLPNDIAVGPDGALWFTEFAGNAIGRITTSGEITEFALPTPNAQPTGIAVGADGNIWFTEHATGAIGRLALDRPGTPGGGGGGAPVTDRTAPRFLKALKVAKNGFTLTLSEPAKLAVAIQRKAPGRRVQGRCVKPTSKNRRRASCDRWVTIGTLRANGLQGPNLVRFTGRLNGRRLAPGAYRASAVATDAAKNVSAASRATFTIRKAARSRR